MLRLFGGIKSWEQVVDGKTVDGIFWDKWLAGVSFSLNKDNITCAAEPVYLTFVYYYLAFWISKPLFKHI